MQNSEHGRSLTIGNKIYKAMLSKLEQNTVALMLSKMFFIAFVSVAQVKWMKKGVVGEVSPDSENASSRASM